MDMVQAGARLYDTPEQLRKYYDDCLKIAEEQLSSNWDDLKQLEDVRTYVGCAKRRLDEEGKSALTTLQAPVFFVLPNKMIAHNDRDGMLVTIG